MKRLHKICSLMLAILISTALLVGCSQSNKVETRTVVDITGAEVEIPAEVDEVVNLFSFGCQMMIGLGLGDYLVGISDATFETQWLELMYPESKNIQAYSDEVSAEALLAVNPDIVFCSDPEQAADFRSKGITAITFMYLTIDDFKYTINLMGDIFGGEAKEKCEAYIAYLDGKIAEVTTLQNVVPERETLHYINGANDRGFYKTGGADITGNEHYGMWNEVGTENPDFHRPEYFGKFIIE